MTGNKFAGKTCAYGCVRPSTTDDHVLAKGWFLEARRDGLPQAPACAECNGAKAKLESELMVVLPFGGRHADSRDNLSRLGHPGLGQSLRRSPRVPRIHSLAIIRNGLGDRGLSTNIAITRNKTPRLLVPGWTAPAQLLL